MRVIETIHALRHQVAKWRQKQQPIALVTTMGNLHAGHLSLIKLAQQSADHVIVSIFVNPLQFSPDEDFAQYPRTLSDDLAQCKNIGVAVVFTPNETELYPHGRDSITKIVPPAYLNTILCGETRPHFFTGVATVVAKLFQIVQPDIAVFGKKDYQQGVMIQQLVCDLNMPIQILMSETQREPDGLALSSRNQYLSVSERQLATQLAASLQVIKHEILSGRRDYSCLTAAAITKLTQVGFKVDYLEIRQVDLTSIKEDAQACVILVAAKLGKTRLIDNLEVEY